MITQKRFYYLDNLKILLTILVITHHVGLAYREAGGFFTKRKQPTPQH